MKRKFAGLLIACAFALSPQVSNASSMELPQDTYYWVQSTSRVSYYFNMKDMHYGVDDKGIIDMNTLFVTTVSTYDNLQIDDVVSKRRWKELPLDGYEDLVGAVGYLTFNLAEGTVNVTKHIDVNSQMEPLDEDTSGRLIKLDSLSDKNVEGIFFRGILEYASSNTEKIIANTNGELSKEDLQKLEKAKKEAEEAEKKAEKERKKAEKEKKKAEKNNKDNNDSKDSKDSK